MKTPTATATISTISVSDARLCDLAKEAFELGLRDGGNGENAKPRRSGKLDEALLPNGIKRQQKVLRRIYDAAFKFQKKRKDG